MNLSCQRWRIKSWISALYFVQSAWGLWSVTLNKQLPTSHATVFAVATRGATCCYLARKSLKIRNTLLSKCNLMNKITFKVLGLASAYYGDLLCNGAILKISFYADTSSIMYCVFCSYRCVCSAAFALFFHTWTKICTAVSAYASLSF